MNRFAKLTIGYAAWIGFIAFVFIFVYDVFGIYDKDNRSNYFRIGPSSDLVIIGLNITIDTWPEYILLAGYLISDSFIAVYVGDSIYPWINASIMNPDFHNIQMDKKQAWLIVNAFWLLNTVKYIFKIGMSMTQIDLFVYSNFGSTVAGMWTSYNAIKGKVNIAA